MLEYLRIQNLALIEDMELEFDKGMNVLTGETGAGKSFILKALGFLLGDRLKADMVRPGADRAHVEAIFTLERPLEDAAADDAFEGGDTRQLILRRDLLVSGRSRLTVNNVLKPQEYARELRGRLLSYTSQHGQQKLLQPAFQEELMESTLGRPDLLAEKARLMSELERVRAKARAIEHRRDRLLEMRDLLEMQQAEIDKVNPAPNEDAELEELRMAARRHEESARDYDEALGMLYGDGQGSGLIDALGELGRVIDRLAETDERLTRARDGIASFSEDLRGLAGDLRRPPAPDDLPDDIEAVESRLYELSQLKRKLRRDLPQILNLKNEIDEKISFLDVCALDLKNLKRQELALSAELLKLVRDIIPLRRASCTAFARALERELRGLGFNEGARVIPDFKPKKLWDNVTDETVRILWAPNPGQPPMPLDLIASGGELSRFLLALVSVAPTEHRPTFIFDEVDSGVGGVTLNHLADRLEQMARGHQMLLVTHWPQIASRARRHFQITKTVRDGRTYTMCTPLRGEALHAEIVRMGGGGEQGEALALALERQQAGERTGGGVSCSRAERPSRK